MGRLISMEKKTMVLNTLLALVLGAGLLVGILWRAFQPNVVLPDLDIPAMAALVLIALVLDYLMGGMKKRNWAIQIVLAAVTFAVLPWAADLPYTSFMTVVCGTAVFAALTWMFDFAVDRLEVTTDCKYTVIPTAFIMYLACQCFMGMII
jgi:hypothetical protein